MAIFLPSVEHKKPREEFSLATDPRVVVVSRVEDFALMKGMPRNREFAVTMPNPVSIPTDPDEIAAIMKATDSGEARRGMTSELSIYKHHSESKINSLPPCIRDTVLLLEEAFDHAGQRWHPIDIRQNSILPLKPHSHGYEENERNISGLADIYGGTTVFYEGHGKKLRRYYTLPAHHITLFQVITHSPPLKRVAPRLTIVL